MNLRTKLLAHGLGAAMVEHRKLCALIRSLAAMPIARRPEDYRKLLTDTIVSRDELEASMLRLRHRANPDFKRDTHR